MSRVGRDYLQVGFYTEVFFREKGVRFIAVSNGVDSSNNTSSEFAPFLNIMNEWYLRDCSRKITAVLRAKGKEGKPITSNPPYGFVKDTEDKNHWLVDEEAAEVEISIREIQEKLMQFEEDTDRTEEFLSLVHKYTDIQVLTPAIVNEFVDKVMVHKIEKTDGDRMQEIEIFLNYIGKVELPTQDLSEEEMAEEEKKRKRRQYSRKYQKAYRRKHRPEILRLIESANAAEKRKQIEEAGQAADELLNTVSMEQVAAMVAGENKVIVDGSLPTKEEVKRRYGR